MHIVIKKLAGYADLPQSDVDALVGACRHTTRIEADGRILEEGDRPGDVLAVLEGWAYRYKILKDGGRQILAFVIPGDFCDMSASVMEEMDHSIGTLTAVTLARIGRAEMEDLLGTRPALTRAFLWAQIVDEGILRAWLVSLGRRDAYQRVGHLLCELWARSKAVGLTTNHGISLPITQTELSDALGLTAVHTNRVLMRLRGEGLIELSGGMLDVPDAPGLARAAGYDNNYLHRPISA